MVGPPFVDQVAIPQRFTPYNAAAPVDFFRGRNDDILGYGQIGQYPAQSNRCRPFVLYVWKDDEKIQVTSRHGLPLRKRAEHKHA